MYRPGSLAFSAAPAPSPIRMAPPSVGKNTAVGSVSDPGWIGRRRGFPFSRMAAAEFEVPKSMARISERMGAAYHWERVRYPN